MDRRDFLWSVSAAGVGAAAAASALQGGAKAGKGPAVAGPHSFVTAKTIVPAASNGNSPFTLSRFAEDRIQVKAQARVDGRLARLSTVKDVVFSGFAGAQPGRFADDKIDISAIYRIDSGELMRHQLWSHRPLQSGGTSQSVIFTAEDDSFVGLEVLHTGSDSRSSMTAFRFGTTGAELAPGVWVLAGPRASTGVPPSLSQFGYSGNLRAPIEGTVFNPTDFAYMSFVVHGEWV